MRKIVIAIAAALALSGTAIVSSAGPAGSAVTAIIAPPAPHDHFPQGPAAY